MAQEHEPEGANVDIADRLLELVPDDGTAIGNQALKKTFERTAATLNIPIDATTFEQARQTLIDRGLLVKGRGRGGTLRRAAPLQDQDFDLSPTQSPPPTAARPGKPPKSTRKASPRQSPTGVVAPEVISYRHTDTRKNNPEVGVVSSANDPDTGPTRWRYDPHLDPVLQFDVGRARIETLIDAALASDDQDSMRAALEELRRLSAPYLNWTGKAERTSFDVETVSLHVHERIDPMSILSAVRKRMKDAKDARPFQSDLFAAPFENLPLRDAIDFYRHEKGWSNRFIAGDSLLVMNSLLQKEGMAGQVQMIYIDPPYGIKYGSNFQPFTNRRDVKDRQDQDLTQEPEMIKAFRDTWELGIHSYLTYLRDRLLLARDLLADSGSVFVQISDENLHHVRELMDEVFGSANAMPTITFRKTTGAGSPSGYVESVPQTCDFLVWYAKSRSNAKLNRLFLPKSFEEDNNYAAVQLADGRRRAVRAEDFSPDSSTGARLFAPNPMTSQSGGATTQFTFPYCGAEFQPGKGGWKTNETGLTRLGLANRLVGIGATLRFIRFSDDFPCKPIIDIWDDTRQSGFGEQKVYAVQTSPKVIERCLLMATDPGDLILDPTCGSGTSAFVAEKWGRRWITCDTSRVALTLAKQRLLTASFDYYALRYPHEGLKAGFIYKTVPHVTLKSIANNPEIDEIHEAMHPSIDAALAALNASLRTLNLVPDEMKEWEVPFDFPPDWPESVRVPFDAFHAARQAMQRRMDASIAAHADQETLYDQPAPDKGKLRITGPFSVEAVPFPTVLSLDEARPPEEADAAVARSGESARQHEWRDELLKTGVRGKGGQVLAFAELETLPGTRHLHVSGTLAETGERAVVSFGPAHAALEQRQVELALREAGSLFPLPTMIVFCAFEFDPEAAKDIDAISGITALKAKMNADLLTEDLKKGRASNQSFWLMGQPDVEVRQRQDGQFEVEVRGFDYFDTKKGELVSGGTSKIALWLLDTDYDERSLYPRQVFFPMAGAKDGWHKLKKNIRAELNESLLDQYHGTVSLPFPAGENRKIAVKIVDDRGIESLKVAPLD
ncbi:site-specific DNA-methyltransferase [Thiocystis violacea]|uniref:site-specific DNA-methyltransferase n=1 Tax=Thiocystis violacea TaxID=13725 RepID=UPI001904FC29|nr:site-specific DNA-methyltransferase [Thiocystis violacea]MBK1720980.1 site-specific DNA-methyltransferase [Thiocystis violacea]